MNNEMWRLAMLELIEVYKQCEIYFVYAKFCDVVFFNKMDTYLQYSLAGKKKKSFKIHKLFWNDTQTQMWTNMNVA